jgi:hypothetical protein
LEYPKSLPFGRLFYLTSLPFLPYFSKLFARAKSGDARSGTASSCHRNGYSNMREVRRGQEDTVKMGEAMRGD